MVASVLKLNFWIGNVAAEADSAPGAGMNVPCRSDMLADGMNVAPRPSNRVALDQTTATHERKKQKKRERRKKT